MKREDMTLLERWDQYRHIGQQFTTDEIRRALARSQALEEWEDRYGTADVVAMEINNRVNELLAGKK